MNVGKEAKAAIRRCAMEFFCSISMPTQYVIAQVASPGFPGQAARVSGPPFLVF